MVDIIKKIRDSEKSKFIFFNYPGSIFYVSGSFRWLTDDCIKKYGVAPPYSMFFFKDSIVKIESALETGLGDLIFKKLNKFSSKFIIDHKKEISRQLKKTNQWFKDNPIKSGQSLDYYCRQIKNSMDTLIELDLSFQPAGGMTDNHFKDKFKNLIKKHDLDLSEDQLRKFAVNQSLSANRVHEIEIFDFIKWLKKNKLISVSYKTIISNALAYKYLKKCYKLGYFLNSGYGGVKLWSLKDEYNLILETSKEKNILNFVEKVKNKTREKNIDFLPSELSLWIKIAQYFSYLRDERKVIQQKFFFWQAETLTQISSILGINRNDLEYLRGEEFRVDFLRSTAVKKCIKDRKIAYLWLWTYKTGHKIWQGRKSL